MFIENLKIVGKAMAKSAAITGLVGGEWMLMAKGFNAANESESAPLAIASALGGLTLIIGIAIILVPKPYEDFVNIS